MAYDENVEQRKREQRKRVVFWVLTTIGGIILLTIALMVALPPYFVWSQRLSGQAELAKAESARRVQVAQAEGEKEAAVLRAQAIEIVGKAAQDFPQYRTQEFIGAFAEALKEGKITQIMYVPTEANIPIVEAGRLSHTKE